MTWLTLFAASYLASAPQEVPLNIRETGMAATVRVSDPDTGVVGSGVVLRVRHGEVYILSAAHVVKRDASPTVEAFTAKSLPKPAFVREKGAVVVHVADADVAVIRLKAGKENWVSAQLAPASGTSDGPDLAWVIGCDRGLAPRISQVAVKGKTLVRRRDDKSNAFFWQVSGEAPSGRSGGPLFDRDGRVIGICSGTQDKFTYYAHIDEIIRAAAKKGSLGWLLDDKGKR